MMFGVYVDLLLLSMMVGIGLDFYFEKSYSWASFCALCATFALGQFIIDLLTITGAIIQ